MYCNHNHAVIFFSFLRVLPSCPPSVTRKVLKKYTCKQDNLHSFCHILLHEYRDKTISPMLTNLKNLIDKKRQ